MSLEHGNFRIMEPFLSELLYQLMQSLSDNGGSCTRATICVTRAKSPPCGI